LSPLALFLLLTALATNLMTALLFSLVISGNIGAAMILRQIVAHMIATMAGAIFVFSTLVAIRGAIGLISARLAIAAATPLQFSFVAVMLCFTVFAISNARTIVLPASAVGWIPSFWFVGLYERLLGLGQPTYAALSGRAVWATAVGALAALVVTVAGYPLQLQRALTPSASTAAIGDRPRFSAALRDCSADGAV
jgi:hypothetical protein